MTSAEKRDVSIIIRLLILARPYWGGITLIFSIGLLAVPLALLVPVPIKLVVDSVIGSRPLPDFLLTVLPGNVAGSKNSILVFAVLLQIATVVLIHLQSLGLYVLQTYTGENLTMRFREKIFRNVQKQSFSFHDSRGTADSIYKIQYDAPSIQHILIYSFVPILSSLLMFSFMIYVSVQINAKLAAIAAAVIPFLFLFFHMYHKRMRPRYKHLKNMESRAYSIIHESMSAFRLVKSYGMEEAELEKFIDHSSMTVGRRVRLVFGEGLFGLFANLLIALGTAAALFVGVIDVQQGVLSVGGLLIVISYLAQLYDPMKSISKQMAALQGSFTSANRSLDLLDEPPDVTERPHGRGVSRAAGGIEFRDVSFAYKDGRTILHDISLAVKPGSCVGIIGRTGAGKSTLVSLLPRFYDPGRGAILLDGIDLRDYKLADLNRQFSFVLQDSLLFSTTISENIAYAKPDATREEIINAAQAAHAHEFIISQPEGYETIVGEKGMRLSGGERQRISLARAFLRNAPVLILDEPASAVDAATESAIIKSMDGLLDNKTSFIISHKFGILSRCNAILLMDEGKLIKILNNVRDLASEKLLLEHYEVDLNGNDA